MGFADLSGVYCGPAPLPGELWTQWNLDPLLLLGLALAAYALRGSWTGLAGVMVLVIAFVSPLCALSAALFSARVVHHVLLIAVAAPLIAAALSKSKARSGVALPFLISTLVLWGWHLPQAYDAALSNKALYWVMQGTLFGSALLFWRALFSAEEGTALLWVLAAYMQMAFLGALLTFAPDALYALHALSAMSWGLTPLTDQQLGGLIMWVPAGVPFLVIGFALGRSAWRRIGASGVV